MKPGSKNIYTCPVCLQTIVTVDRVDGTTPMRLACRATPDCDGYSESGFYPRWLQDSTIHPATYEWYTPERAEMQTLDGATFAHVSMGGLLIRKITT